MFPRCKLSRACCLALFACYFLVPCLVQPTTTTTTTEAATTTTTTPPSSAAAASTTATAAATATTPTATTPKTSTTATRSTTTKAITTTTTTPTITATTTTTHHNNNKSHLFARRFQILPRKEFQKYLDDRRDPLQVKARCLVWKKEEVPAVLACKLAMSTTTTSLGESRCVGFGCCGTEVACCAIGAGCNQMKQAAP